ncbi:hypothetical protein K501DRAFT_273848 [Backusella circina FSU 941]|nr:hypothetical protein K501DRAFT_273848 [Backusella circina FSU 941]
MLKSPGAFFIRNCDEHIGYSAIDTTSTIAIKTVFKTKEQELPAIIDYVHMHDGIDIASPYLRTFSSWLSGIQYIKSTKSVDFYQNVFFDVKICSQKILREIFLFLHQDDKLECMLVCRHWKEMLEHSALYHTFCIFSQASLDWLTEKIQKYPDISSSIERLVICYQQPDVNLSTLLPLLPSIKTILCSIGDYNNLIIDQTVQYPWSKYIKRIDDSTVGSIAYHLLSSNTCPNLTTLKVADYSRNIIPLLKNAPALTRLSLGFGIIPLKYLEIIHQNTPYLKSLIIQNVSVDGPEINDMIEPATSVTECIFTNVNVGTFKMRIDLLVYILKKYPSLSKFIYNVKESEQTDRNIDKLNECGWNPLFQGLGPQLKTFGTCGGNHSEAPFQELDHFGCRIENMKIWTLPITHLDKLAQSHQALYIQTLVLTDIRLNDYEWLKDLQLLRKFKIDFLQDVFPHRVCINMSDILENASPTLKSLSLHNLVLEYDVDYTGVSNVETLSFYLAKLPTNIDGFISCNFPSLSTLKLKNCKLFGTSFNLAKLNLFSFRFTEYFQQDSNDLQVFTLNNNEQHIHSVKKASYGIAPLIADLEQFALVTVYYQKNHTKLKNLQECTIELPGIAV